MYLPERSFFLGPASEDICRRMIFITGNGRSGTTILGKIIHSFVDIEYSFEPPTLLALIPSISNLAPDAFKLLFATYCFEDLMLGQVTGRSFNFNSRDDSFIELTKAKDDIERRLGTAWSKPLATRAALQSRLAVKIPDMTTYLQPLRNAYDDMTFVVTQRDPNGIIQSVVAKGWFKDETLQDLSITWPSLTSDFTTPIWVDPADIDGWRKWSELERAAYYYCRITEGSLDVDGVVHVAYERLTSSPHETVEQLADRLNASFGPKTGGLIADTYVRSPVEEDLTAQLTPPLRKRVERLVEQCRAIG